MEDPFISVDDFDDDNLKHRHHHRHDQPKAWCGPEHRTKFEVQSDWNWWRNFGIGMLVVITLTSLTLNGVFVYGMAKNAPMMEETSKATVDMHYQTTKMRTDVTAWGTRLLADYPVQQDKIWLARGDKISKNVEDISRKLNLAILADDFKLANIIPIAVHSLAVELIEPETKMIVNKRVKEAFMLMQPTDLAKTFKTFNKMGDFIVEMKEKGIIDRVLDMIEDGDTVFKGMISYFNQPKKVKKRNTVRIKKKK